MSKTPHKHPIPKHSKPHVDALVEPVASAEVDVDPSVPLPSADPVTPSTDPAPKSGFSFKQKLALIGGALILALVLYMALSARPAESRDPAEFSSYLLSNPNSGILMDTRGASADVSQRITNCGINLISGGFFVKEGKDLFIVQCNDTLCQYAIKASPNDSMPTKLVNTTYTEALGMMSDRAYIHVRAAREKADFSFHPHYMEMFIAPDSNPADCKVNVNRPSDRVPSVPLAPSSPSSAAGPVDEIPSDATAPTRANST